MKYPTKSSDRDISIKKDHIQKGYGLFSYR